MVARCITPASLLLTFCDPNVDVQLIHLQHNVLLSEFEELLLAEEKKPVKEAATELQETSKKSPLLFRGVFYDS